MRCANRCNTVETDQSIITSSDDNERFQSNRLNRTKLQQAVDVDQLKASHISSLDGARVVALLRMKGMTMKRRRLMKVYVN